MRIPPGRLTVAAACGAAVVAMPSTIARATSTGATLSMGAPSGTAAKRPADVRLTATPARPTAGTRVTLSVRAPSAGDGRFAWDLNGGGAFSRHTAGPQTTIVFATPGVHAVAVRFERAGRLLLGRLSVTIAPRPRALSHPRPRALSHLRPRALSHLRPRALSLPRPRPRAQSRHPAASGLTGRVTAHAAGDPGVTIADFHFSPATTTIHVGDTITWSNSGPSSHTATARNGSFNTGILKKGQSASHTFTQAGTFSYVCQIHPFMHGTIVVLAATTSTATPPTTSTPSTSAATSPTATSAAQTGPTLPNTGFDVLSGMCAGLVLLGVGMGLRRTRPR